VTADPGAPPPAEERRRRTSAYYDRYGSEVAARTGRRDVGRALAAFTALLPPGGRVLDIGCGVGEHMAALAERGYRTLGLEPSSTMRALARARGLEVLDAGFEELAGLDLPPIDGVWCAASLLHVPLAECPAALAEICRRLPPGGPLYVTVRLGEGAGWDTWRGAKEDVPPGDGEVVDRFMQTFTPDELVGLVRGAGLEVVEDWVTRSSWGRAADWIEVIARAPGRGAAAAGRP
jgi:SAM-dependent methyltransferase